MVEIFGELENNVLTGLVWDAVCASTIAVSLGAEQERLFSTPLYRQIARAALGHFARYSKPPGVHIRDLFEEALKKDDDNAFLLNQAIEQMARLAPSLQAEYVLDALDQFISSRRLAIRIEKASDQIHAGNLAGARETLYHPETAPATSSGTYLDDTETSLAFLDAAPFSRFSSGVAVLDRFGIVPKRKTLLVFIAPPKRGKSWFLVGIGRRNLHRHKRVLHITLEMSEQAMIQRYIQAEFAYTHHKAEAVTTQTFNRDAKGVFLSLKEIKTTHDALAERDRDSLSIQLTNHFRFFPRRLLIKEFPTGSLTVGQLHAYLDMLKQKEDFVPDMILLDYPDLMQLDSAALRVDTGVLFRALRGLAVQRNLALVAPTQGNRASSTSRHVRIEDVAEDFSKIGTADTIITYSQTSEERRRGLARLNVTVRDTEAPSEIWITQSYATGQFCLDSQFLNIAEQNILEAQIKGPSPIDSDKEPT